MLKYIRDKKDSWFVKGILVLTALSFMSLFGIQGVSNFSESNKTLARVGKVKIPVRAFYEAFDSAMSQIRAVSGSPVTLKQALDADLPSDVMNTLVSRTVASEFVDGLGIVATDDDVYAAIVTNPAFAGYDGAFSRQQFNEYLSKTGQNEKRYVALLRDSLRAERVMQAVRGAGVSPKSEAETMYRLINEKRSADVFTVREDDMEISAKPSDKELRALYDRESENLIAPEYRRLSVMNLTREDAARKVEVTDAILKDIYEMNRENFITPETRAVSQMLLETQADADKAMQALKKGDSFDKVAEKIAKQTKEQTSLGQVVKDGLLTEISDPVFEAKKGAVVGPVKTAFGWQILRVDGITPRKETSFKQAKAQLEKDYRTARAYDLLDEMTVRIEDALGEGKSLEDVARDNGLRVQKYGFVDMGGADEDEKSAGPDIDVVNAAFTLDEGQVSPLIDYADGYFAVRTDEIKEPQTKSFEKAKAAMTQLWTREARAAKAKQIAARTEELMRRGVSLSKIASQTGVKAQKIKDVTRQSADIAPSLKALMFLRNKGDVFNTRSANDHIVGRLTGVTPANPDKDVVGAFEMQQRMNAVAGAENARTLLNGYAAHLKTSVDADMRAKIEEHLYERAGRDADED